MLLEFSTRIRPLRNAVFSHISLLKSVGGGERWFVPSRVEGKGGGGGEKNSLARKLSNSAQKRRREGGGMWYALEFLPNQQALVPKRREKEGKTTGK